MSLIGVTKPSGVIIFLGMQKTRVHVDHAGHTQLWGLFKLWMQSRMEKMLKICLSNTLLIVILTIMVVMEGGCLMQCTLLLLIHHLLSLTTDTKPMKEHAN